MIKIAVIDSTAESRGRILDQLDSFLRTGASDIQFLPRVSLKPISPQELKFNAAPDVCLVGPELVDGDITEISRIKKLFPNIPLMVWLNQNLSSLNVIEQIARQGADDVLTFDASAQYFFRRLLMVSRKAVHQSSGKLLVVDGGKGGVGVTTISAALGELVSSYSKKVAIVDCDFETQDCSRFLQARPFINENLRLLLDEERAVTEESVEHCLSVIWHDDNSLRCMAPVPEADDLYDPRSRLPKTFLSILEVLDANNDLVIIDIGCARSSLQKMFYRVADKLVFVVNDDPASLYASVDKLNRARSQLSAGAQLCVIENCIGQSGLGNKLLRREFLKSARLDESNWAAESIPFCKIGQRWPGSGSTFYSQAKASSAKPLQRLAVALKLIEPSDSKSSFINLFSKFIHTEAKTEAAMSPVIPTRNIKSEYEKPLELLENVSGRAGNDADKHGASRPKLIEHQKVQQLNFKKIANSEEYDLDSLVSVAKPR